MQYRNGQALTVFSPQLPEEELCVSGLTIDASPVLENKFSRLFNLRLLSLGIHVNMGLALIIGHCTQTTNIFFPNKAVWAWTGTKIANGC